MKNIVRRAYAVRKSFLRMVEARSYPRENIHIGGRISAAQKYFLRMVEARSYPRENIGTKQCMYVLKNCE